MACWLYEGMLVFGVVVAAGLVFSVATDMRHGLQHRYGLIAFLFVVLGMYFTVLWSKGQTLAMQTWKIRIVDRFGRPLTRPRAFVRYVFCYIWLLPPLAAFSTSRVSVGAVSLLLLSWVAFWALLSRFNRERQFLHDVWAGTRLLPATPVERR
jgi:uncharacterized RDD family membrane protein YckC